MWTRHVQDAVSSRSSYHPKVLSIVNWLILSNSSPSQFFSVVTSADSLILALDPRMAVFWQSRRLARSWTVRRLGFPVQQQDLTFYSSRQRQGQGRFPLDYRGVSSIVDFSGRWIGKLAQLTCMYVCSDIPDRHVSLATVWLRVTTLVLFILQSSSSIFMLDSRSWTSRMILFARDLMVSSTASRKSKMLCMISASEVSCLRSRRCGM